MRQNPSNHGPRPKSLRFTFVAAALAASALALPRISLAQDSPATAPADAAPAATAPSATAKTQAQAHLDKAKALYEKQKYADAQAENDQALRLDPANSNAILLRRVLAAKIAAAGENPAPAGASAPNSPKIPVLDNQQMSTIRLMEIAPNDRALRGKIDRSTLEDFWQDVISKEPNANTSPENHTAWLNAGNFAQQVRLIKASGDPKFTSKVTLTSDPQSINGATFSFTSVQTYMLQNCATSECHGGDKAGDFRLIPTGSGASGPQQLYTNFYIMSMYKIPGDGGGKMIDRENPDKSLFLAYGLPHGHPDIDIPHKMQSTDLQYHHMIDWIKSLTFPQPNYAITYALPGGNSPPVPTPAPATTPASAPSSAPASTQR